jgi:hypothetical protein
MTLPIDHNIAESQSAVVETVEYSKPKLRKIRLAAEEVLTTGCKIGGVCDVLGYPNPTGAGS